MDEFLEGEFVSLNTGGCLKGCDVGFGEETVSGEGGEEEKKGGCKRREGKRESQM